MFVKDCPVCWYEVLGEEQCPNCGTHFTEVFANEVDWEAIPVDLSPKCLDNYPICLLNK